MHILHVVGARPNFIKAAAVMKALCAYSVKQTLVHTGQHYDANMSSVFFVELEIPQPHFNLDAGSGTDHSQTAEIVRRIQPILIESRPDILFVYGDVNSTIAASLAGSKLRIPICHVEAGLRSFDKTMPEEINRIVTDHLSEVLFAHCEDAVTNLTREGIPEQRIHFVGNVMIDSLIRFLPLAKQYKLDGLPSRYALLTLHRPFNVDNREVLNEIIKALVEINTELQVVFPVHPRTRRHIAEFGIDARPLRLVDPVSYIQFLALETRATAVITDSGGVQEETTYLKVPCITLRENTERPITVTMGTNVLVGQNRSRLKEEVRRVLNQERTQAITPPLWDGHAAERIASIVMEVFGREAKAAAAAV